MWEGNTATVSSCEELKFGEKLKLLKTFGFSEQEALEALQKTSGDIYLAADYLADASRIKTVPCSVPANFEKKSCSKQNQCREKSAGERSCPSCTFLNPYQNETCQMCGQTFKNSGDCSIDVCAGYEKMEKMKSEGKTEKLLVHNDVNGEWLCSTCTLLNSLDKMLCEACGSHRPDTKTALPRCGLVLGDGIQKAELTVNLESRLFEKLQEPALRWLTYESEGFQINSACSELLTRASPNSQTPVNLVMVFGPARQGKSFLMNCLSGIDNLFQVSYSNFPCTKGVNLSTQFQKLDTFAQTVRRIDSRIACPIVGFVDCEGQGDQGGDYDITLTTPLLLLSKIVIFNWPGRPNKAEMLDKLAVIAHAANKLAETQSESAFGDLFVVLRDCPSSESVYEIVMGAEVPAIGSKVKQKAAINERNLIREMLSKTFKSVKFYCLPRPHPEIERRDDLACHELCHEFAVKFEDMKAEMIDKLKVPHTFGGQALSGPLICSILTKIKDDFKEDNEIVPASLMQSIVQKEYLSITTAVKTDFLHNLTEIMEGCFFEKEVFGQKFKLVDEQELQQCVNILSEEYTLRLGTQCNNFCGGFPGMVQKSLCELKEAINEKAQFLKHQNQAQWSAYKTFLTKQQQQNEKTKEQDKIAVKKMQEILCRQDAIKAKELQLEEREKQILYRRQPEYQTQSYDRPPQYQTQSYDRPPEYPARRQPEYQTQSYDRPPQYQTQAYDSPPEYPAQSYDSYPCAPRCPKYSDSDCDFDFSTPCSGAITKSSGTAISKSSDRNIQTSQTVSKAYPGTATNLYRTVNGVDRQLVVGPRGGTYYINGNGNRTYVKDERITPNQFTQSSSYTSRSIEPPKYSEPRNAIVTRSSVSSSLSRSSHGGGSRYSEPRNAIATRSSASSSLSRSSQGGGSGYKTVSGVARQVHTGSRGGQYYINSNGNKTYLKK